MAPGITIRGTGAEISQYVSGHPNEEFLLVTLQPQPGSAQFDRAKWNETIAMIESFRGKFPVLTDEAFSTDSLYD